VRYAVDGYGVFSWVIGGMIDRMRRAAGMVADTIAQQWALAGKSIAPGLWPDWSRIRYGSFAGKLLNLLATLRPWLGKACAGCTPG
jgi:hypothetical protein